MKRLFIAVGCLGLVALGCGLVFAGFEFAAYEQTIADREVTVDATVMETDVSQVPGGNWTYHFEYEYTFDQRAEIHEQGLEAQYPDEMTGERRYSRVKDGGEHDSESEARDAMTDHFDGQNSVTVYVDPYQPDEGSLTDVTTLGPRALQYGGSIALFIGLVGLARLARRVSA